MTARLTGIGVVVFASVATIVAGVQDPTPPSAPQQPTFRSTADLVSIEVAIRGRDLMRPLQPSDFELRDNNVRQTILSVEPVTIPVDVSVIVDVSGAVSGFGDSVPTPAAIGARLDEIVRDVRTVLRVGDAFRLVTVDTHATEVVPLEQVGGKTAATAVGPVASDGLPSLNDALAIEMMRAVDPGRRHVVVVATPGVDSMSVVDLASLRDLARRSEAIVDVVHADSLIGGTRCVDIPSEAIRPCAFARRRVWQPPRRDEMDQLSELASLTGGRFHPSDGLYVRPTAVGTVKDTVNDLRNGVVLRYTPRGVSRTGWHDVAVTLPGLPNLKVAGRRGYVIEPAVAASPGGMPTIAATTGSEGVDATLAPFVKAFDAGDYSGLQRQLRTARDLKRIIRDFVEGVSPWPGSAHTEAVFALELANAGFGLRDDELDPEVAKLLQRFTRLVRQPIEADEFECAWLWTESAVLEGAMRPAVVEPLVIEAARRCPADPRLQLARAVIADQRWPLGRLDGAPAPPGVLRQIAEVPPLYDAAMTSPSVAVEARVRAAWFAYRAGNLDRALTLIDAAGSGQADRHVLYLRALIRGHVLRALGRTEEAEAAYRAALEVWPGAQSSQVSLMTLWLGRGNRAAAESTAEAVQVAPAAQFDPWWMYWQGDFRAYDAIVRRLREQKR